MKIFITKDIDKKFASGGVSYDTNETDKIQCLKRDDIGISSSSPLLDEIIDRREQKLKHWSKYSRCLMMILNLNYRGSS